MVKRVPIKRREKRDKITAAAIPTQLHESIQKIAYVQNISYNTIVNLSLENYVKNHLKELEAYDNEIQS